LTLLGRWANKALAFWVVLFFDILLLVGGWCGDGGILSILFSSLFLNESSDRLIDRLSEYCCFWSSSFGGMACFF
jgi:hypothetical protein